MLRTTLIVLAVLLGAPHSSAQSLNIDLGPGDSVHGAPAPSFAAATGQLGSWTAVDALPAPELVDLAALPSAVVLDFSTLNAFTSDSTNPMSGAFTAALMQDALIFDANVEVLTFQGLVPGAYRLATYGSSNLSFAGQTVTVQGVSEFMSNGFQGTFVQGQNYVLHDVVVDGNGRFEVRMEVVGFSFISLNGFQLTRVGQLGTLLCPAGPAGGTGGFCPCGNDPAGAAQGCVTTRGDGMRIWGTGSGSLALDDMVLTADRVPLGNTGIFYVGRANFSPGNPLFDGLQCTGGSTVRFQGQVASTGTVSDTGFVAQDVFGGYFNPAETYVFQYFSRDNQAGPSPCGGFANLSPGLRVVFAP